MRRNQLRKVERGGPKCHKPKWMPPLAENTTLDLQPLDGLIRAMEPAVRSWRPEPMPGGASTRRFFRLHLELPEGARTSVAFFVPDASRSDEIDKTDGGRAEWPFLEVHRLLTERGVTVPRVLADGSDRGWLVVEDLGDDTLAEYLLRRPETREQCYRVAVTDLARAQQALRTLPPHSVVARRAFDEDLLAWEIHHFREWALEGRGFTLSSADRAEFDRIALRLSRRISSWPRGFVHRDYQSRNLMVREQGGAPSLVWIDFQDALLGPRVYDLVALLGDSYQTFDRPFIDARLQEFSEGQGLTQGEREALQLEFELVMVQRKLKDAGRFIFIDRVKGNPNFLPFVEPTIQKVRASLDRLDGDEDMRALREVLRRTLPGSFGAL